VSPSHAEKNDMRIVLIAAIVALVAVILVNVYIERVRAETREETFTVYILRRSVQPGDAFKQQDVRQEQVPVRFRDAFPGALDEMEMATRTGRARFRRFAPEGAVLDFSLFQRREESNFDRQITRGKRLVALPVNSRTIPGNVRPGMFVDVEAPFGTAAGPKVLPVLERVKVFAVGQHTMIEESEAGNDRGGSNYRTITIEVEPRQATLLADIQRIALSGFELHLRNPDDPKHPKIPEGGINPRILELLNR